MCGASVVVWCRVEPSIGTSTKHTPIQWIIERERESEREREREEGDVLLLCDVQSDII